MPVISTNNAANVALLNLNINASKSGNFIAQLASGSRIVQASSDSAGLAMGVQMQAASTVLKQDKTNVEQAVAILQSTDGALAQIGNILQRIMSLAATASSGQVTDANRADALNVEYTQLKQEMSSIINTTRYIGQKLLSGSFLSNTRFLVGTRSTDYLKISVTNVSIALTGTGGLLGSGSSVATRTLALTSMSAISVAIGSITKSRAKVGAYESQFDFSGQVLAVNVQNTDASISVIMDADVAAVKAQLAAADVKTQAAIASLIQAIMLPSQMLKLIQA